MAFTSKISKGNKALKAALVKVGKARAGGKPVMKPMHTPPSLRKPKGYKAPK